MGIVTAILIIALYFLPTIIAATRENKNQASVFVINFFLGWTLLGWVAALAMAVGEMGPTQAPETPIVLTRRIETAQVTETMHARFCAVCGAERRIAAARFCWQCGRAFGATTS